MANQHRSRSNVTRVEEEDESQILSFQNKFISNLLRHY